MVFTSFEFVLFFLAVVLAQSCLRNFVAEKWLLLGASVFFYLSWSIPFIAVILFTCAVDYHVGRKLGSTDNPVQRKRLLVISLLTNLGVLGFFKYGNFILENVFLGMNALGFHPNRFYYDGALPGHLVFYVCQHELCHRRLLRKACTMWEGTGLYALYYVLPQTASGAHVRAVNFLPELQRRVRASVADIEVGLAYILMGAVKKAGHFGSNCGPR